MGYSYDSATRCECWVADPAISQETRFSLRWGAHSRTCPTFRESRDPVDRAYDNDLRRHGEAGRMNRPKSWYSDDVGPQTPVLLAGDGLAWTD